MIRGAHLLLYSCDSEADRAFLRDVLNFQCVDAGQGWLIFALPPAELGVHPGEGALFQSQAEQSLLGSLIYLMCDDLDETIAALHAKGVSTTQIQEAGWGKVTSLCLPSGGRLGLYEPQHATAIPWPGKQPAA